MADTMDLLLDPAYISSVPTIQRARRRFGRTHCRCGHASKAESALWDTCLALCHKASSSELPHFSSTLQATDPA